MERENISYVVFINGRASFALADVWDTTETMQATKYGLWAGVQKFRKSASVYVYKWNGGRWELFSSFNARNNDERKAFFTVEEMRELSENLL